MREDGLAVAPLKQIILILKAGTGPDKTDLTAEPIPFEFIFGVGAQGLSPFEFELAGKREGDCFTIPMRGEKVQEVFQHLLIPALQALEKVASFHLKTQIVGVREADPKQVIKAMAEAAACADHCCGH